MQPNQLFIHSLAQSQREPSRSSQTLACVSFPSGLKCLSLEGLHLDTMLHYINNRLQGGQIGWDSSLNRWHVAMMGCGCVCVWINQKYMWGAGWETSQRMWDSERCWLSAMMAPFRIRLTQFPQSPYILDNPCRNWACSVCHPAFVHTVPCTR